MNKFELTRTIIIENQSEILSSSPRLLDVGCRGCELKPYVADLVKYSGADLFQNPQGSVDHVLDVSNGLPFDNASFDYVVALDLVEHLDDFEGGLDELLRVTRKSMILMLPNLGHLLFRLRFLLSARISGKYDMKLGAGQDRHRWLTTQVQSDAFLQEFADSRSVKLKTRSFVDSWKKRSFATLCRTFGLSPNVWSWASLYVLEKPVE